MNHIQYSKKDFAWANWTPKKNRYGGEALSCRKEESIYCCEAYFS